MNDRYDDIEAYIQNNLSEEDQKSFEEELQQNSKLEDEVEFHRLANSVLIEQRVNGLEDLFKERKTKLRNSTKLFLGIGISTLIAGSLFFLINDNEEESDTVEAAPLVENTKQHEIASTPKAVQNQTTQTIEQSQNTSHPLLIPAAIDTNHSSASNDSLIANIETVTEEVSPSIEERKEENNPTVTTSDPKKTYPPAVASKKEPAIETETSKKTTNEEMDPDPQEPQITQRLQLEIAPLDDDFDELPFTNEDSGILYIYSRNGDIVQQLEIIDGQPAYWNGEDQNGNVNYGYYVFTFENSDTTLIGGITVVK